MCPISVAIMKSETLEIFNSSNPPHFSLKVFAPAHFCSAFSCSVMNVLSTETFSELLFQEEELFSNYEPLSSIL